MNLKAVKNLFKLWLKFEDVLDSFQPQSRRGNANTYCRTNLESGVSDSEDHRGQCSRVFRKIDACKNMDQMKQLYPCRYRKLNIQSYSKLGGGRRIYIIPEADRSSTCVMRPEEY